MSNLIDLEQYDLKSIDWDTWSWSSQESNENNKEEDFANFKITYSDSSDSDGINEGLNSLEDTFREDEITNSDSSSNDYWNGDDVNDGGFAFVDANNGHEQAQENVLQNTDPICISSDEENYTIEEFTSDDDEPVSWQTPLQTPESQLVLTPDTDEELDRTIQESSQEATNETDNAEVSCPICLDSLKNHNYIYSMECGHCAGSSCLKKWLKENKKCPLCSKTVDFKELRKVYVK
ncbi:uncharacterized protein [Clytia hemisphaerica]|uniref:RING-type domain-containing protein n=1 Tax=Clytia hemisphaerica TaxID=252671 RepID=A0A7M5UE70_9CNID